MKYFKGANKKTGDRAFFKLFDELQEDLFDKKYIIEASHIERTGLSHYESLEKCKEDFYVSREIGEAEYNLYRDIQHVVEEIYQHGYTGGFPREENVKMASMKLHWDIKKALAEIEKKDME